MSVHEEKGSKRNTDTNVQLRSAKIKSWEEDSQVSEAWVEQHTAKQPQHCSKDGCENEAQNWECTKSDEPRQVSYAMLKNVQFNPAVVEEKSVTETWGCIQ